MLSWEKAAASLLESLPVLRKILHEREATNRLVEVFSIYLARELFLTELEVLAFFNHHLTLPFLNCVARRNQEDLVKMLPKFYDELMSGRTDTLNGFIVCIHYFNVVAPTSDLFKIIISDFCVAAAAIIKLQCCREYGFENDREKGTAGIVNLNEVELKGLPTNNLIA